MAASITGVRRGDGWRPVPARRHDLPYVARIMALDDRIDGYRHCGSGFIIGNIGGSWLVVATAAHVFEDVDEMIGLRERPPPALEIREPPSLELSRSRTRPVAGRLACAVWLPHKNLEVGRPVVTAEVCWNRQTRDIALLFVQLAEPATVSVLPLDLDLPLAPDEPILVAGFGKTPSERLPMLGGLVRNVPERRLTVREGFLAGMHEGTGLLRYQPYDVESRSIQV